jgi:hypothetical protein
MSTRPMAATDGSRKEHTMSVLLDVKNLKVDLPTENGMLHAVRGMPVIAAMTITAREVFRLVRHALAIKNENASSDSGARTTEPPYRLFRPKLQ